MCFRNRDCGELKGVCWRVTPDANLATLVCVKKLDDFKFQSLKSIHDTNQFASKSLKHQEAMRSHTFQWLAPGTAPGEILLTFLFTNCCTLTRVCGDTISTVHECVVSLVLRVILAGHGKLLGMYECRPKTLVVAVFYVLMYPACKYTYELNISHAASLLNRFQLLKPDHAQKADTMCVSLTLFKGAYTQAWNWWSLCSQQSTVHLPYCNVCCLQAAAADNKEKQAQHRLDSVDTATPSTSIQGTSNAAAAVDTQAVYSHESALTALSDRAPQEALTTALGVSDAGCFYTNTPPQVGTPCVGSRFMSQAPQTAGHPHSRRVQSPSVRNVDSRQPVDLHQASSSWCDGYLAANPSQPSAGLKRLELSHIMQTVAASPRTVPTEERQPNHTESVSSFPNELDVMTTDRMAAANLLLSSTSNPHADQAATDAAIDRMWDYIVHQSNESVAQNSRMEQWPLQVGPSSPRGAELGGCGGAAGSQDVESGASVDDGLVGTLQNEYDPRSFPHSKRRRSEEGCIDMWLEQRWCWVECLAGHLVNEEAYLSWLRNRFEC